MEGRKTTVAHDRDPRIMKGGEHLQDIASMTKPILGMAHNYGGPELEMLQGVED